MADSIKINKLEIENVKRIKAVKIEPTKNGLTTSASGRIWSLVETCSMESLMQLKMMTGFKGGKEKSPAKS